jgi:MraZ protein
MQFRGTTSLSLDAKGRMAIPARYRDALMAQCGGDLVLTAHPHGCLLVYPLPEWDEMCKQVENVPALDRTAAALKRLLVGYARDEQMDTTGRVLIAPELRKFADLQKQVCLVGLGRHFELWPEEAWNLQSQATKEMFAGNINVPGLENLQL